MIEVWFDGLCDKNPYGKGGVGAVIERNGEIVHIIAQYIGEGKYMSNNVAEYAALHSALLYLERLGLVDDEVIVYGDSRLVIEQMSGHWKITGGLYTRTALATKALLKCFPNITLHWIPREQNVRADELSRVGVEAKNQRRL